jgi:CRP-like cAMP-binding protein
MNSSTAAENEKQNACRLTNDFELLRHSSLFSGLHLDVVKLFAYLSTRRNYRQGDLLIEQGNQADSAFIINDGMIDIIITHKKREVVLQQLNKGDFFGELALLAQFDWFFSARAATDLQALVIERSSFQKILEKYPDYKDQLIERIVQLRVDRLIDQTNFILENMVLSDTDQAAGII